MAGRVQLRGGRHWSVWRIGGWALAALLLALPAAAMQFTDEVSWAASDFIIMGGLIGSAGLGLEFLLRRPAGLSYRLGAALAVLTAFLTIWANLAIGMIGSENNPFNLLFGGVLLVGIAGAILSRFEAAGMAFAMVVTAIAQGAVGALGLSADMRGGVLSMAFTGPWLLAAALFWYAAREQTAAGTTSSA